ncbi:hypothetical protein V8C86DRAFT_3150602 [Haematococcus lacustris]
MSLDVVVRGVDNKDITRFAANKFLAAKYLKNALEEHKLWKVEISVKGSVRLLQKFADVDYNRLARVLWQNRYDKAWEASGAQNNWGVFSTSGEVVEAVIYSHADDEGLIRKRIASPSPSSSEDEGEEEEEGEDEEEGEEDEDHIEEEGAEDNHLLPSLLLSEAAGQPAATPSRPNKQAKRTSDSGAKSKGRTKKEALVKPKPKPKPKAKSQTARSHNPFGEENVDVYDTAHKAGCLAASMFAFRSVKPLYPIGKEPHGKYCAWKTKDPNAKWEAAEITAVGAVALAIQAKHAGILPKFVMYGG